MATDNRTNEKIETRKCSNQACPLRRAHSGPCAPSDWKPGAPSEAQVEAALAAHEAHKGAWVDEFREMVCPECGWCYMTEHERRSGNKPSNEVVYARVDAHRMRAALVAAAGAAPQAESEAGKRLSSEFRADLVEAARERIQAVWADVPEGVDAKTLAQNVVSAQEFFWLSLHFPVQPSSTVDAGKLTQAIYDELMTDDAVSEVWSNGKVMATARRLAKFAVVEAIGGETPAKSA